MVFFISNRSESSSLNAAQPLATDGSPLFRWVPEAGTLGGIRTSNPRKNDDQEAG
jgi:hypothetical protein